MCLGCKPGMIIDFLIMFAGAPAECGEQSKQRTAVGLEDTKVHVDQNTSEAFFHSVGGKYFVHD